MLVRLAGLILAKENFCDLIHKGLKMTATKHRHQLNAQIAQEFKLQSHHKIAFAGYIPDNMTSVNSIKSL